MLKIKIGSTWAETRDTEIPVTLRSPLFLDNGRIPGSFIFNFNLPHTPAMKAETGFIHRPARFGAKPQKKPFYLEYGPLKYSGTCSIENADEKTIEISAPVETGSLAGMLKTMKMHNVGMGGMRVRPANNLTFNFSLNCIHNNGTVTFRLYVNSISVGTYVMGDGTNSMSFNLSISPSDVVTWDILLESQPSGIPDEYSIDWTLVTGSSITVVFNAINETVALTSSDVVINSVGLEPFSETIGISFDNITTDLKSIFDASGTFLTWFNFDFLDSILAMYPDADFAIFPLENQKFMDNIPDDIFKIDHYSIKEVYTKFYPVLNYFKNGGFPSLMSATVNGELIKGYNLFCPFPYFAYFIKQLFAQLNINIVNNVFEASDLNQLVIYNAFAENEFINNDLIKIEPGFDLKNHVPDENISEFLNETCKLLGIAVGFDSYTNTIKFANLKDVIADRSYVAFPGLVITKPVLKREAYNGYKLTQVSSDDGYVSDFFKSMNGVSLTGTVATYFDLPVDPEINDIYFVSLTKIYYIWTYDEESASIGWKHYSFNFDHTKKDVDENEEGSTFTLESQWSAVMDSVTPDHSINATTGRVWKIPRIDQAGNFEGMPRSYFNDFSTCLLFYRGLQPDILSENYPLGTHGVHRYGEVKITGADLSLNWEGEYGLWEKRHKAWVEWMVANPGIFTIKAFLSSLQLSQIDWFKWYRVLGHDYLIREIRFNIMDDKISECEMDLMRR